MAFDIRNTRDQDKAISPEGLAAIAAYKGKVTKCPTGKYALDYVAELEAAKGKKSHRLELRKARERRISARKMKFERAARMVANGGAPDPLGLNKSQRELLAAMADWVSTATLAEKFGVERNSMRCRIRTLNRKGLLERHQIPHQSVVLWRAAAEEAAA